MLLHITIFSYVYYFVISKLFLCANKKKENNFNYRIG